MVSVLSPEGRRRVSLRSSIRGTLVLSRIATPLLLALAFAGCSQEASVATDAAPTPSAQVPAPEGPLVVFLGDSLTAGYGLSEQQAFPALLGELLPIRVVNAGV